jgi:hypothetical protein
MTTPSVVATAAAGRATAMPADRQASAAVSSAVTRRREGEEDAGSRLETNVDEGVGGATVTAALPTVAGAEERRIDGR